MDVSEKKVFTSKGIMESQTAELKTSLAEKNQILETISAFANTNGGSIYVGLSENRDGSVKEVVGVAIKGKEIETLTNEIKQNTDPTVFPSVTVEPFEGKKVVVISVEENKFKPVFAKDRAFKRVGKTNRRLSTQEIMNLAKDSVGYTITHVGSKEATLCDIDKEKVAWFVDEARMQRNSRLSKNKSLKDILINLHLIKGQEITNAALLLFGKDPQKAFLQAEVSCVRFKGNFPVKPFIDFILVSGTIIDQIVKVENFILRNIKKAGKLVSGEIQRKEVYEYPPQALREAIVNALVHRDYERPSKIQVRIFDDRLEIWNPGFLPKSLTLADLSKEHQSIPRNPLLAKLFYLIRYVEELGTGTNDIISFCKKQGLPKPTFEERNNGLLVTFSKYKNHVKDLGPLNERQKKLIIFLKTHEKLQNKDYHKLYPKVSRKTLVRDLQDLAARGLIVKKGKHRGAYYEIT